MFKTDAREIIEDAIRAANLPGLTLAQAQEVLHSALAPLLEQPTAIKTTVVKHAGTDRVCGAINVTISEIPYL